MTVHLAAVVTDEGEQPALVDSVRGVVRLSSLGWHSGHSALDVIREGVFEQLANQAGIADDSLFQAREAVTFTAPYRTPRKVWGIGLNYREHAADLAEAAPDQPASFVKCDHTIIGQNEPIVIPRQSGRVTSEAEIGLIIGRECENVTEAEALDYVWGVTTILDQTAEDILRQNPRYLTRSKNFRSFFCFGPELVPLPEVLAKFGSLDEIEVSTVKNNSETRTNTVANMTHGPRSLVSFHSQMMPLYPGDIISTGTPGALVIADGDTMECRIPGVGSLSTTVRQGD